MSGHININRLMNDIENMANIGKLPNGGICRRAMSVEDMQGRAYLIRQMEDAGLTVKVDAAGNIIGRKDPHITKLSQTDIWGNKMPALLMGSHIDTMEYAGKYDGVLGVFSALECIRTLNESGYEVAKPIEIIAFNDEEERFLGFLGSYAFTGVISYDDIKNLVDRDGVMLVDVMRDMGLDPIKIGEAKRDPKSVVGYLELHIEQGPLLEQLNVPIGVVKLVKGDYRWNVTVKGQTNHAGFPWEGRKDAFMASLKIAKAMADYRDQLGSPEDTLTIGRIDVNPNVETVQPGLVNFSIDFRSPNKAFLLAAAKKLQDTVHHVIKETGQDIVFTPILVVDPVVFDFWMQGLISDAAQRLGYRWCYIPSGAGHDAQIIGQHFPSAMIFVPSIGGRSHCPDEYSRKDDIENATSVLYEVMMRLAE